MTLVTVNITLFLLRNYCI